MHAICDKNFLIGNLKAGGSVKKSYLMLLILICFCGCVRSPTSSSLETTPSGDVVTISADGVTKSVHLLTNISLEKWYAPSQFKQGQQRYIGGDKQNENRIELYLYTPVGGWNQVEFEKELPRLKTVSLNDYKGDSDDIIASYTRVDGCFFVRTLVFKFSENFPLLIHWRKLLVKEGYSCTKKFNQWAFKKSYTDDQLKILEDFVSTVDSSIKIVSN